MDNDFVITFEGFNEGNAPLAHLDDLTFIGNKGQSSDAKADVISKPGFITQGPALVDLTNGNQAGVVDQLIRHILDKPTATNTTYAVGTSKLFKLTSTSVVSGGSPSWPQAISGMTEGESVIRLKANLFAFYNKASGGDIAAMPLATEVVTANWGSVTDQALENAPHPSAVKEDILMFGNGRYAGVYIEGLGTLDVRKLDFGEGAEVVDIVFTANMWWIAVNYGEGRRGQIYLYDGSAISNQLSDEAGLGDQQIGFLYVLNGNIYVAYQDKTSDGFTIGLLAGRAINPLRSFEGSLPDHRQKALYKNTILFVSGENILSAGASVGQLPYQVSTLVDGGYATVGGIAAPFGTPLIASSDGAGNYRLATFSGYAIDSFYKSVLVDLMKNKMLGKVNTVIVITKRLTGQAACTVTLEGNQGDLTSNNLLIGFNGTGDKTRHIFNTLTLPAIEDVRACIDWSNGDATNDCPVRRIILMGTFSER
jgi:hypothetical protein